MIDRQTEANRRGALGWAQSLDSGDFPGVFALHAEDVIVNLLGTTGVSGNIVGRDAYFDYTYEQVMIKLDPTQEPYLKQWRLACADHNAAAIFMNASFPAADGLAEGRYDQKYLVIIQADDNKIRKLTEMVDTAMIETAIYRRKLTQPRVLPPSPYDLGLVHAAAGPAASRSAQIELAESWIDAIRRCDQQLYADLLKPDLVANIIGWTPYSGRWFGRDAFLALDFDFHSIRYISTNRIFGKRHRVMCADERGFCVLLRGSGLSRTGRTYDQYYSVVASVTDGLIAELHIHLDTAQAEGIVFGNDFVDPPVPSPHAAFSIY